MLSAVVNIIWLGNGCEFVMNCPNCKPEETWVQIEEQKVVLMADICSRVIWFKEAPEMGSWKCQSRESSYNSWRGYCFELFLVLVSVYSCCTNSIKLSC